jgi:trans-aconitate 2-methyltransferase
MFFDWLFMYLTPEEKEEVMKKTENALREERFVDGSWIADYRRIRLVAVKKT